MTLVLNGKGLLLEGSNPKIEDKQVPGIYTSPKLRGPQKWQVWWVWVFLDPREFFSDGALESQLPSGLNDHIAGREYSTIFL